MGQALVLAPLVMAVIEGLKGTPGIGVRVSNYPFIAGMGVAFAASVVMAITSPFSAALVQDVLFETVITGLSASGLYSGGKSLLK